MTERLADRLVELYTSKRLLPPGWLLVHLGDNDYRLEVPEGVGVEVVRQVEGDTAKLEQFVDANLESSTAKMQSGKESCDDRST